MKKLILTEFMLIAMIGTAFAELDPIAAAHVNETEDSQVISMGRLRLTELEGLIAKRKPLTVVNRGDGTDCVFDGNNTYSALKELGAKNVPVTVLKVPYQKDIGYFFPSVSELSETAMDLLDKEYNSGSKNLRNMMLAAFLWPAVKNSGYDSEVVLNAQEKVFAFDKEEKEALTAIFGLEHEREHFNEAYILLQMRAATNESLKEILTFWEGIITDKDLKEAV
ncbi:MAG: hypothetical protein IJT58_01165 [Synergistaceae bacterium]|nr:hypothetical protein [Synergistaceae bacterium]